MGFISDLIAFFVALFSRPLAEPVGPRPGASRGRITSSPTKRSTTPPKPAPSPRRDPTLDGPAPHAQTAGGAESATIPAPAPAPAPEPPSFLDALVPTERKVLCDADYVAAAQRLNCGVAVIKAVAMVESGGRASWDAKGRPVVLYEPHKFSKHSQQKFEGDTVPDHPELLLSDKTWVSRWQKKEVRYPADMDSRWLQIREAYSRNPDAALAAVSWGKFQVLGENWDWLGYKSVSEMVQAMSLTEAGMLESFERFITRKKLGAALRSTPPDWEAIAAGYNGTAQVEKYAGLLRKKHAEIIAAEAAATRAAATVAAGAKVAAAG